MKRLLLLVTLIISGGLLLACEGTPGNNTDPVPDNPELQSASKEYLSYFSSSVVVRIYIPKDTDTDILDEIFQGIDERLETVHELATRHESFDDVINVRTLNENPGTNHEVDPLLFELLEKSIEYHDITDGYFDVTLGPVIDLWDARMKSCNEGNDCYLPDEDALNDAGEHVDIDGITMDEDTHEVAIEDGMELDLGGVAKGYAVEQVSEYLKEFDVIDSFLISAGTSSMAVHGDHPTRENDLWNIQITDPEDPDKDGGLGALQIGSGKSISTSGDYQSYFTVNDERYHHLIDPFTLYPAKHYRSVTLLVDGGLDNDILSTALFLMPPEESRQFIAERDNMEALWVMPDGSLEKSENFEDHVLEWRN